MGNINNNHVAGIAEIETNARVSSNDLTSVSSSSEIAGDYLLNQNYPNPFNPSTKINFSLPKAQNVSLKVYDINGKEVALLISGKVQGGNNSIDFFAGNLPSGIYIYRLEAGNFVESKKMILLK